MQTDIKDFGEKLMLPDTWQSRALGLLRDGRDVVLHAPTGAGKTYVFELLIESSWRGRAVYTVPTRALANDKFSGVAGSWVESWTSYGRRSAQT